MHTTERYSKQGIENVIDYKELSALIKGKHVESRGKTFLGTVTKYDDTPRRGRKGTIFENVSAEVFKDSLRAILCRSKEMGNEFVFLNAWNEWGEGMYLEPDTVEEYAYLEAVREALDTYDKIGYTVTDNIFAIKTEALYKTIVRYQSYWKTFEKWMVLKHKNCDFALYFRRNHISRIAVYGMGMMAKYLAEELKKEQDISIVYGIDQKYGGKDHRFSIPIYTPEDKLPQVELIVVTVEHEYAKIRDDLKKSVNYEIKSLCGMLDEIGNGY